MFSGSAGILGIVLSALACRLEITFPFHSFAGGNVGPGLGGPVMDDNEFPGGEKLGLSDAIWNVFPYKWKTTADYLEQAGVSWRVYQPNAKCVSPYFKLPAFLTVLLAFSLVDNGFFYFEEFQNAATQKPPGPLAIKGKGFLF